MGIDRELLPVDVNVCMETWIQDKWGNWILENQVWDHNMVTQNGFNLMRDRLAGSAVNPLSHFAIGTGTTTPVITNAALETEIFRDVITAIETDDGLLTITYFLGSSSANGNTLGEIGLLNASSSGVLFARAVLAPTIVKNSTRQVTFTWYVGINTGVLNLTINRYIGYVVTLGGDPNAFAYQTAYPSGAGGDKVVSGSEFWYMLPSDLPTGTYAIEAMMKTNHASGQGTIALVNLDDDPDTALAGSSVSGTVGQLTGERIRSTAITFGSPVSSKNWGVKVKSNNAAYGIAVWGLRIIQIS